MRQEVVKKEISEIRYFCEVCNKEYLYESRALECERVHSCEHEYTYEIYSLFESYGIFIKKRCFKCDKQDGRTKQTDDDLCKRPNIQRALKQLYEAMT
jgi:hypothetical protein